MIRKSMIVFIFHFIILSLNAQIDLNLSDAIQKGLKYNFDIQIAKIKNDKTVKDLEFGISDRLPTIDLRIKQENSASFDNSPTSFVDGTFTENELKAYIELDWSIFNGFRLKIDEDKLDLLNQQSNNQVQVAIEQTIELIILTYYKAVIENDKLKINSETRNISYSKYQNAEIEASLGKISAYELYEFENTLLQDSIRCSNQEIVYQQALLDLDFLIGLDSLLSYNLSEQLTFHDRPYNYNSLEQKMLSENQNIINQYTNIQLAENAVEQIKSEGKPRISLYSNISEELTTSKFKESERNNGGIFDMYIGFSMTYNLFNGKQNKIDLYELSIEKELALKELELIRFTLKSNLKKSFEMFKNQKQMIAIQKKLIDNLSNSASIAEERVKAGYSLPLEYRELNLRLLEAKFNLLETYFELKVAETQMMRLTGGITQMIN